MSEVKRILLGTIEICRQVYDLADAFRRLGYRADTFIMSPNPQHPDLHYDFTHYQRLFLEDTNCIQNPMVRYPRHLLNCSYKLLQLLYFLTAYDVYIFQFGGSLLRGNRDYPLLKRLGKKIVSLFCGSDIRHWSAAEPVRQSFGLKSYSIFRDPNFRPPLCQNLATLRMAERYADVIFAQPSFAELAVRPYMHFYLAVNLELYDWFVPGRDVPLVVHAPSLRRAKGTEEILATLEKLKSDGIEFELRLLEGVSNKVVIRQLVDADIVIDELNDAHYGMLALEAMATGCAIAGGNHPGLVPLPPNPPVLPINPANVYSQLRRLLTDKDLRLQLASQGRPFVERYYNHLTVAQHMLQCLDLTEDQRHDYYPTFFARDYRLPNGETIGNDLKRLTAQIVQRWGLPEDVDPQDMIARGLMSLDGSNLSKSIPRSWASTSK